MEQREREFVFQQYGLGVIKIIVIIVDVLVDITIFISDVICAENLFFFLSFNSPNFWENLSHPLLSGIRSELDEVSAFIVLELH